MSISANGMMASTNGRGDGPDEWRRLHPHMTPSVSFTWHHTIPLNCIVAVWNGLVAGQHWSVMTNFLRLVSAPGDPATIVKQMREGRLENRDGVDTALTWQGWNVVAGPGVPSGGDSFRTDDPGENFDRWPLWMLSGNQRATQQAVEQLHVAMTKARASLAPAANDGGQAVSGEAVAALDKVIVGQMRLLRGRNPIPFNERMWVKVREGRVSRKYPGVWEVRPQWEKAAR